jgi:DNA-binding response OmpR family regulator
MHTSESLNPKILIIEDDMAIQQALTLALQTHDLDNVAFSDGASCIDYIDRHDPHLDQIQGAIIDYHLPDINGIQLATTLRRQLPEAAKIVLISGQSADWLRRHHTSADCWPHLQKPFSIEQLIEKLR